MKDFHPDRQRADLELDDELAHRLGRALAARRHQPRALMRSVALRIGTRAASAALLCTLLFMEMGSEQPENDLRGPAPGSRALSTPVRPEARDPRGVARLPTVNDRPHGQEVDDSAQAIEGPPYPAQRAAPRAPGR